MPKDFTNLLPPHEGRHPGRSARISGPTRRRIRRPLLALASAALLLATACGSGSGSAPVAAGTPKPGGSMTIYVPGESRALDPFQASYANVSDGQKLAALYDTLVWTNPRTGAVQPHIAESLAPTNQQATTWRLKLRPGVRFSDGTAYDAEAVRTNWEAQRQSAQRSALTDVKALKVVDPVTLDIDLSNANANFDRTVARQLTFVASPKSMADQTLGEAPVGAGPFVLEQGGWVKNDHLTLKRNPNYWQAGKPYLDEVVFRPDSDIQRSIGNIDAGKGDATITIDPQALQRARDTGLGTEALDLSGGQMITFNMMKGPFTDRDARRAMALSLSGTAINDRFFNGTGTPARGIFNRTTELANNQLAAPEDNPDEAKAAWNRVTQNGTRPFTATLIAPISPTTQKVVEYMATEVSKHPGVTLNVENLDLPTFIQRSAFQKEYDVKIGQLWADDPEPSLYNFLYGTNKAETNDTCCFYFNEKVNDALDAARRTSDPAQRRNAYTSVQRELNADTPFWVYQEAVSAVVFNPKITGVQMFNDGILLMDRVGLRKG